MSNDFSTYDFSNNKYDNYNIRLRWDTEGNKFWFVLDDVLSVLYTNPNEFWAKLKQKIPPSEWNESDFYTVWKSDQEDIQIADLQQLERILEHIPRKRVKKAELWNWLNYPMPNSIEKATQLALQDGIITKTERNDIIQKAGKVGISAEYTNRYINHSINLNNKYKETEDLMSGLIPLMGLILLFCTAYICFCLIKYGIDKHLTFLLIVALYMLSPIIYNFISTLFKPSDIFKGLKTTKELEARAPKNEDSNNQKDHRAIPQAIINEVSEAVDNLTFTFDQKAAIIQKAVQQGIKKRVIENNINNTIKKRYLKYPINDLKQCPHCHERIPDNSNQCLYCGEHLVWQKIKQLTNMALSDRVLTDLERKTIVKNALQGGIKPNEINEYLFNALNERLKTYTKVDLRDCPYCGAQIPLVSDECLYCGKPLEHIEGGTNIAFNISGKEADIIRSENLRIEEERHGIKECPDCGAPFPLISNICPSCGHVLHERYENKLNIKNLLNNIMRSINRINDAPKPKVYQIIGYWLFYILLLISIFTFVAAIAFNSEAGKALALTEIIASLIVMFMDPKGTRSPAQIADGEYYKARYAYEMYARQVETLYGDDPEARPLLKKFEAAIKRLKRERYKNRIRVTNIIGVIALTILGIITYSYVQDFDQTPKSKPKNQFTWTIPQNADSILSIAKTLKPYPENSGVETRLEEWLEEYLYAPKDALLTFVLDSDNESYHWKINRVELISTGKRDTANEYASYPISISLLDKDFHPIGTLSESTASNNHSGIMLQGNNKCFADFWSKHSSKSDTIIKIITGKATYYSINTTKPKPPRKRHYGR